MYVATRDLESQDGSTVIAAVFQPELRLVATEPVTGAEWPFGYDSGGTWVEVALGTMPNAVQSVPVSTFWMRHPETLTVFDRQVDALTMRKLADETCRRCLDLARRIVEGLHPALRHPLEVWPVLGTVRRVEIGENVPRGITHIRRAGSQTWFPVSSFLQR